MSSPSEPGAPNKGDGLDGDGSAGRSGAHSAAPASGGRSQEATEAPPWQRGASRAAPSPYRQTEAPGDTRTPAGADPRLSRFASGSTALGAGSAGHIRNPAREVDAASARGENSPPEAYASELPDLSGPMPRSPQRKPAPPDRGTEGPKAPGSGRPVVPEGRDLRDERVQVSRRARGPVRASMQIRRIDPWSTLKVSLLLSVALFFVWMIAVAFLYLVLGGMGVWAKLNSNVGDLLNNTSGSSGELVSSGAIFGGATLIGLVNIVLLTAMATIAAFVYNLTTDLIGGIEVTLADRD